VYLQILPGKISRRKFLLFPSKKNFERAFQRFTWKEKGFLKLSGSPPCAEKLPFYFSVVADELQINSGANFKKVKLTKSAAQ